MFETGEQSLLADSMRTGKILVSAIRRTTGVEVQVCAPGGTEAELDAWAEAFLGACERVEAIGGYVGKGAKEAEAEEPAPRKGLSAAQLRAVIAARRAKAGK